MIPQQQLIRLDWGEILCVDPSGRAPRTQAYNTGLSSGGNEPPALPHDDLSKAWATRVHPNKLILSCLQADKQRSIGPRSSYERFPQLVV